MVCRHIEFRFENKAHNKKQMNTKYIIAITTALALLASPVHALDEKLTAGIFAGAGAATGGATFATVGAAGLAIGGTAVAIGLMPMVAVGTVAGLAGYGIYRIFH